MDFFALFGLPKKLQIEPTALENKYHELIKQHHPDSGNSKDLETSAAINLAYKTLLNPWLRVKYYLEHFEMLVLTEQKLTATELMEFMELDDDWQNLSTEGEKQGFLIRIKNEIATISKLLHEGFIIFDMNKGNRTTLIELFLKHQYLNRLKQNAELELLKF